jgi:hypothetical protein
MFLHICGYNEHYVTQFAVIHLWIIHYIIIRLTDSPSQCISLYNRQLAGYLLIRLLNVHLISQTNQEFDQVRAVYTCVNLYTFHGCNAELTKNSISKVNI